MGEEVKKKGIKTKHLVAGIAIGVIIVAMIFLLSWLPSQSQRNVAQTDIVVIEVEAQWIDVDYANVTATLHNRGDANGYATVKLYTFYGDQVFDDEVKTVFVPANTRIKVSTHLDVNSSVLWYASATIMDQWKS